jgi:peptidoglycan/LPS O-acetylase OafA/YrhL
MNRLLGIDFLRVLSLLIVVLSHYNLIPWLPLSGTHGVVIFFMISGYCIELTSRKKSEVSDFALARFWRLIPTFVFCAFLITFIENIFPYLRPDRIQTFWDFLLNVTCMPTLDIPCGIATLLSNGAFGRYLTVDGAFWSLSVEFKYYVFFALLFYILKQKDSASFIISLSGLAAFLTSFLFAGTRLNMLNNFFLYLPFFAFGMGYYIFKNENPNLGKFSMMVSLAVFIVLSYVGVNHVSMNLSQSNLLSYAACFAIFFFCMQLIPSFSKNLSPLLSYLGLLTYPLYLVHQDLGYMIIAALESIFGHIASALIAVASVSILAYLVNIYFESKLVPFIKKNLTIQKSS